MRPSFLLFVALTCCVEPARVRILDGDPQWGLVDVPRRGLTDLDQVAGPSARLWVGSALVDGALDPPLDADQAGAVLVGEAPHARWTAIDAVAVPDDYDTLALFSAFTFARRALDWFERAGVRGPAVSPLDVHYLPDMAGSGLATADNAYYLVPADAILLLPPDRYQDVPLAMNAGVLAHEIAHRVAYRGLWDSQRLAVYAAAGPQHPEPVLLASALDEGLADYFGAVVSGDPAFVGESVASLREDRDVSRPRVYDADWIGSTAVFWDGALPNPYRLGSVVASALWATGEVLGHERVSAAIVEAQAAVAGDVVALRIAHTQLEVEVVRRLGHEACDLMQPTYAEVWASFAEVCP